MSLIQVLQNLSVRTRVNQPVLAPNVLKPLSAAQQTAIGDFQRARTTLLGLYRDLERLAELANVNTRFKLDLPDAQSSTALGLDLTQTAASLSSTEEINASPMSFSPFGPDWDNGSDALITIGGEYNGADGSGTMLFDVRRDGTHGVDNLTIRFEDPQGSRTNIVINANHPEDRQYDLQNGLYLTLGPGSLINNDTTSIQLFDNIGASVNPDNPFGGLRNSNPNLQFGTPSIVNGSFQVNGQSITVTSGDSLNDIVARINASTAGVTASFNATTERIEFLQNTLGSIPDINLQNDTSNFLQAMKLGGALVTPGIDAESDRAFADVAAFASVQTGSILINGQQIAIDTAVDSLSGVIDRINSSSAGVTASFDPDTQRVLIEANDAASQLVLDSNGTGFFAAIHMPEGRVDPEAKARGISRQRSYDIADATENVFQAINKLFRDSSYVGGKQNAGRFRSPIEAAFHSSYGSSMTGDQFGMRIDNSAEARLRGDFASLDRRAFTDNLQRRGDAVQGVIGSKDSERGLIRSLLLGTRQALANVNQALGISGTFVDTYA